MSKYSFMDKNGLKVMRIASMIGLIIISVFLFLLNMIDSRFTHISKLSINIIISIVIILVYIILFIIVIPLLRYHYFHYYFDENEIYIRKGMIAVETVIIPFYRIQNIDVIEGFIMRKYKLAHLHLSTAGGECNIELITKKEALYLKQMIQNRKNIYLNYRV